MEGMIEPRKRCRTILALTCLALALWGPAGCSDNDPVVPDPIDESYPWPDSPDALMANFAHAYEEMDMEEYGVALHADFEFIFINYEEIWLRAADTASTAVMFAGEPGVNPDGYARDGVQSIDIQTLNRDTPWTDMPGDDTYFPGTKMAVFSVKVVFTLEGGNNTITVQSDQEFYVQSEDVAEGGDEIRTRFYLAGQRDLLGDLKANEEMTWGSLKTLYEPQDEMPTNRNGRSEP